MAIGQIGQNGVFVASHVEEVLCLEIEHVLILNRYLVVKTVLETIPRIITATLMNAQVLL